jgi:hypothetical protein
VQHRRYHPRNSPSCAINNALRSNKKARENAGFFTRAALLLRHVNSLLRFFCHEDFYTAVLGAAIGGAVIGNRLFFTAAINGNLA